MARPLAIFFIIAFESGSSKRITEFPALPLRRRSTTFLLGLLVGLATSLAMLRRLLRGMYAWRFALVVGFLIFILILAGRGGIRG